MLTLKLLGSASIEGSGGPVTGRAAQGRRLALLAALALAGGRRLSRDKLVALLWPEIRPERARPQLSDTLYILRGALGEDVVRSVDDALMLKPDAIDCDVTVFDRLLDEGRLAAAVELVRGPLLDGFHLSDAPGFEEWLSGARARIAARYAGALESLAEACEADGRFAAAVDWWGRLAVHDPYNGRVALRLMRALDAAGDRAGALRHARVNAAFLREEFDADPDAEVAAFAERLRVEQPVRTARESVGARPGPPATRVAPEEGASPGAPPSPRSRIAPRWAGAGAVGLLLVLAGLAVYGDGRPDPGPAARTARSVGVLPFVNMSPDSADPYFSDGLSEQIITALSRVDGLRVAARTSSFALRDRDLDVRAIGDTLGVETVLEGSVRRDGNRLRVTAQLIDAATGYHVWTEQYDGELVDVFALQDQIAGAIAETLQLGRSRATVSSAPRGPVDLEAYDLYLRGLYLRNTLSEDPLRHAAELFDRAIALEPDFAAAWAAKASVVAPLIYFGHVPVPEGVAELRALTSRALELDPTLGEAHAALGILRLFFDWDWEGAERSLRRALELNPSDPHAWHHLANYHSAMGRPREAIAARGRSVALDPLNARPRIVLAVDYFDAGEDDRSLEHFRGAIQLDPVNPLLLGFGPSLPLGPAMVYRRQGRFDEAVEEYLRVASLRGAPASELDRLRDAYAASGMPGFWRAWLELDGRQSGAAHDPLRLSANWALVGDTAQTLDWLERAFAERNPGLIYLRDHTVFEILPPSHPRVARILAALAFPP